MNGLGFNNAILAHFWIGYKKGNVAQFAPEGHFMLQK
jgi:hypothetical protein